MPKSRWAPRSPLHFVFSTLVFRVKSFLIPSRTGIGKDDISKTYFRGVLLSLALLCFLRCSPKHYSFLGLGLGGFGIMMTLRISSLLDLIQKMAVR
jgi:hypothetical protein